MTPAAGLIIGGRYELLEELAQGGMGSIWRAKHGDLDIEVAVKFMDASMAKNELAAGRFRREAKAAARLKSPHITRIHDYGLENETPYIAMELLDGHDLRTLLRQQQRLEPRRVADIVSQLAKGLEEAHAAGIVHRDLKPANIFLARVAGEEMVKILDFGIAKETQSEMVTDQTSTGALVGSPRYMSPEQARGNTIDHRSDLWSLACVAYEALTGARAFSNEHIGGIIADICSGEVPTASKVVPALGSKTDAFFSKALAQSADDRFQSASELAAELDKLASGLAEVTKVGLGDVSRSERETLRPGESTPSLTTTGSARLDDIPTMEASDSYAELARRASSTATEATLGGTAVPTSSRRVAGKLLAFVTIGAALLALGLAWSSAGDGDTSAAASASASAVNGEPAAAEPPTSRPTSVAPTAETEAEAEASAAAATVLPSAKPSAQPRVAVPRTPGRPAASARPPSKTPPQPALDPIFGVPVKK